MVTSLAEIKALGANSIAIHPYARVLRDGSITTRLASDPGYLERAAEYARRAGIEIFWKPHLAYWGSFEWRGAIDFGEDQTAWSRFFSDYRRFITEQARLAERLGVKLLAIGVEYEQTTSHEQAWRSIIAAVRAEFSGQLTYAANWDTLDRVPFWDALDLIGIHAYFPLVPEGVTEREALWRGWEKPLADLEALASRYGKGVILAEIGYPRSIRAAHQPWTAADQDLPEVRILRQTLIEVALERIEQAPFIVGMYWWKWIPGDDRRDRDFSMKDPEARMALQRYWAHRPTTPLAAQ